MYLGDWAKYLKYLECFCTLYIYISLLREGATIPTRAHSSAVSDKPRERLCGGSSRDETVVKHLVRFTSGLPGAVTTDFMCETMNMDFH